MNDEENGSKQTVPEEEGVFLVRVAFSLRGGQLCSPALVGLLFPCAEGRPRGGFGGWCLRARKEALSKTRKRCKAHAR